MRKLVLLLLAIFLLLASISYNLKPTSADEIEDLQKQIDELNKSLELSKKATSPLEGQLSSLQRQLKQIQASIDALSANIKLKQKELDLREDKIALQQSLLEERVKAYYIRSYLTDPLLVILSSFQSGDLFRELSYRQTVAREDRQIIVSVTSEVVDLLNQKDKLEKDQAKLALLQAEVDKNAAFLGGEIKKAKTYQAELSSKIAQLSTQQQNLIAQKLGGLNIPRSAATSAPACIDDRNVDPGFSQALAFFTYGVPNRTGLNQYGAKGRAQAGQNFETILKAYYNYDELRDVDQNTQIRVDGHGQYSLEEYMKRIYEVPENWPMDALKAQAIAARSYALSYTNNGSGSICATQSCQVFQDNPKTGNWATAVQETAGKVMVQSGNTIKAWFSSTHGGYILSTSELPGWSSTSWTKHATDTPSGGAGSFGELQSNAYDKDSPWFYCDWGARSQYNKTAWLKSEEIADIANVILLARAVNNDSSITDHFYQTDKPHPYGREVWNEDRVKSELRSRNITVYNNVSDVSINADFGSGKTTSVAVSGDGGNQSFDGGEFKDWFNLRAPANIQIVGPLFNVEKK